VTAANPGPTRARARPRWLAAIVLIAILIGLWVVARAVRHPVWRTHRPRAGSRADREVGVSDDGQGAAATHAAEGEDRWQGNEECAMRAKPWVANWNGDGLLDLLVGDIHDHRVEGRMGGAHMHGGVWLYLRKAGDGAFGG